MSNTLNNDVMESHTIILTIALIIFIGYSAYLTTTINHKQRTLQNKDLEISKLEKVNNGLSSTIKSNTTVIQNLRSELISSDNLNKQYKTDLSVTKGKVEELHLLNVELSGKLENEKEIHRALESTRLADIKSLREQNREADKMIQAHIDERNGYRDTIKELRENNKVLKAEKDSLELRVKNDTITISKLKKELSTTKGTLTKTKKYLESARESIKQFNESQKEKSNRA